MRRVGILGGMGPEATILIMRKVPEGVETRDDAGHVPPIVDQNPQMSSRIRHLIEGTGDDPGPVLAAMAQRLAAAGAQALAMILRIKAEGPQSEARRMLKAASDALIVRGARVQMIACTDLSLIAGVVSAQAAAFDTLDRLVREILSFSLSCAKEPSEIQGRRLGKQKQKSIATTTMEI